MLLSSDAKRAVLRQEAHTQVRPSRARRRARGAETHCRYIAAMERSCYTAALFIAKFLFLQCSWVSGYTTGNYDYDRLFCFCGGGTLLK